MKIHNEVYPNSDMISIVNLYLKNRNKITQEERTVFFSIIKMIWNPLLEVPSPLSDIGDEMRWKGVNI